MKKDILIVITIFLFGLSNGGLAWSHGGDDEDGEISEAALAGLVQSHNPNGIELNLEFLHCSTESIDIATNLTRTQLCRSAQVIRRNGRYDSSRQQYADQICNNENTTEVAEAFEHAEEVADEEMSPLNHRISRALVSDPELFDTYWQATQSLPGFCEDPAVVGQAAADHIATHRELIMNDLKMYNEASGYEPWSWPNEEEYVEQRTEYLFGIRLEAGTLFCNDHFYPPPLPGRYITRHRIGAHERRPNVEDFECNAAAGLDYNCPHSSCYSSLHCIEGTRGYQQCATDWDRICAEDREESSAICQQNYQAKCEEFRIQWTEVFEARRTSADERYQNCLVEKREQIRRELIAQTVINPNAQEGQPRSEFERLRQQDREASGEHRLQTARARLVTNLEGCRRAFNEKVAGSNYSDFEATIVSPGCAESGLQGEQLSTCLFWKHRKYVAQEIQNNYSTLYYGEDGGQAACTRETGSANICRTIAEEGNVESSIQSIYSPERMTKLNGLVDRLKSRYGEYIDDLKSRGRISESAQREMMARLENLNAMVPSNFTQMFYARQANGYYYHSQCRGGNFIDPIVCQNSGLVVGPQLMVLLDREDGEDILSQLLAHEIGHGVIPRSDIGRDPWADLTQCLSRAHSHQSINPPCAGSSATCESSREEQLSTLKMESLADYFAAEVLGRELQSRVTAGESRESVANSAERMILRKCIARRSSLQVQFSSCMTSSSPTRDSCISDHPLADDRTTSFLGNPQVQRAIGCNSENRRRSREQTCAP